jgi:CIC family chloride channel protein
MTSEPRHFQRFGQSRLLLWAFATGLISGSVAALFRFLAIWLPRQIWWTDSNLVHAVGSAPTWEKLVVPVAGALMAGLALAVGTRWSGPAQGWDILEAVALRDGILYIRPALVKSLSSLMTVASAGPVGREGPMVLLAATISSLLGRRFNVSTRQLRILVGCGVAAGIAVAYNTPIGAALFTMEIIIGNFALDVFAPLVFASVAATLIARGAFGSQPVFALSEYTLANGWEIGLFAVLGVLGGLAAAVFLAALRLWAHCFRISRLPRPVAMSVAGLALGLTMFFYPQVVGNGREAIRHLFTENWSISLALILMGLRLILTPMSVGAGTVGGVFTPALFIGAVLGNAFGLAASRYASPWIGSPRAYALVGMGSLLAGTTHAPLTAVVMIFEMTQDYGMVLPLLVAAAGSSLVARTLNRESIYTEALRRKQASTQDSPDAEVMRSLTVRDIMRSEQTTVPVTTALPQLLDRFITTRRNHLYIVDEKNRFCGVISIADASAALRETRTPQATVAGDIMNTRFQTTTPGEHLDEVLQRFWVEECERLPVLDGPESRRVIGTISQRDILGVYSLEVLHRRALLARFNAPDESAQEPTYVELPADHRVDEARIPESLAGVSIAEAKFRETYGLSVLMVRRIDDHGRVSRFIPDGSTRFEPRDRLIIFGSQKSVSEFQQCADVTTAVENK